MAPADHGRLMRELEDTARRGGYFLARARLLPREYPGLTWDTLKAKLAVTGCGGYPLVAVERAFRAGAA